MSAMPAPQARANKSEALFAPLRHLNAPAMPKGVSKKQNVLMVSGTRPEIIKLAPVYHALREAAWANVVWLHTAQHGEMARQILDSFDIDPGITSTRPGSSLIDFSMACRAQLDRVMNVQS